VGLVGFAFWCIGSSRGGMATSPGVECGMTEVGF